MASAHPPEPDAGKDDDLGEGSRLAPSAERACELCGRSGLELTRHHLIPQLEHRRNRTRRRFDRKTCISAIALLCRPCHRAVHQCLSERELAAEFNTVLKLAAHPCVARFVAWVASKPPGLKVAFEPWGQARQRQRGV